MKRSIFEDMHKILPLGEYGEARLDHFTVSKRDSMLSGIRNPRDFVPPGDYVRLYVKGEMVMSNTPFEQRMCAGVVYAASGDVLIAGLGLGMILLPILKNKAVTSVTVIEKSYDTMVLVLPPLLRGLSMAQQKKLTVLNADIFKWQPPKGKQWDTIWFDIWPNLCTDYLADMAKLHRRFARRNRGSMDSWGKDTLIYQREQEKAMGW